MGLEIVPKPCPVIRTIRSVAAASEAWVGCSPALAPEGGAVRFDMVDVIEFRDGLLWTKNTYIDAAPIAAQVQPRGDPVKAG